VRHDLLKSYEAWVMRSKSRGQFADIRTHIAALIVDTQHGGAMQYAICNMQYAICNMQVLPMTPLQAF
jgi:hypothetical protein